MTCFYYQDQNSFRFFFFAPESQTRKDCGRNSRKMTPSWKWPIDGTYTLLVFFSYAILAGRFEPIRSGEIFSINNTTG